MHLYGEILIDWLLKVLRAAAAKGVFASNWIQLSGNVVCGKWFQGVDVAMNLK